MISDRQYGAVRLRSIAAKEPDDWDTSDATHVRVSLPSDIHFMLQMQQRGYQFVDRTLDVTVGLRRLTIDFQKSIRLEPVLTTGYKKEIKQVAKNSFTRDRRFHVEVEYRQELADQIIDGWIDEIPEFYICVYKGSVIGFLALKEAEDGKSASIHLAAVEERYRASGAALSLYANALKAGMEKRYQSITGCISSYNTAVLNLYASLGGVFFNPQDIYVRE